MLGDGIAALKCIELDTGLFHLVVHIAPRGEHTLAPHIGQLVHA